MYSSIDSKDVKNLIGNINIIDIRENYLYNLSNIPTSKNIPSNYLLLNPNKYLDKNKTYYIYCSSGYTSALVCNKLSSNGYKVINILGGYKSFCEL